MHLVKQPEVTLIVDGYNVAKLGWPTAELPQQRDRLLDSLEDLVRRIGVRAVVVFDGADVSCPPTWPAAVAGPLHTGRRARRR